MDLLNQHRRFYQTLKTKSLDFRLKQLLTLRTAIKKYEKDIIVALEQDLGKHEFEAYTNEVGFTLDSIGYTMKHLKKWAKDQRVKTPIHQFGSKSFIQFEPYGTVLIIAPFNYPFQLLIEPLIGAIAAGNTVVLKPSEYTVHTEAVILKMMDEFFEKDYITVITGGREMTTELINSKFDYIFFTGSVNVGKVVMKAAAENLIPVTLELGGKSPTIVDKSAKVDLAAKRIAWGKFLNAGQTCIAPDYVYVHQSIEPLFKEKLKTYIHEFYGHDPKESVDYGHIVTKRHHNRLIDLIHPEKIYSGGSHDHEKLYIEPTILENVTWSDPVMGEEIFGPILPILKFENLDEVIDMITSRDKPLALYLFAEDKSVQDKILKSTSFGGGAINDTISHVASPYLPFGGVGPSGMGGYHGKYSFEVFSHRRSLIKKSTKIDMKLIYPPYKDKVKLAKLFMK